MGRSIPLLPHFVYLTCNGTPLAFRVSLEKNICFFLFFRKRISFRNLIFNNTRIVIFYKKFYSKTLLYTGRRLNECFRGNKISATFCINSVSLSVLNLPQGRSVLRFLCNRLPASEQKFKWTINKIGLRPYPI